MDFGAVAQSGMTESYEGFTIRYSNEKTLKCRMIR